MFGWINPLTCKLHPRHRQRALAATCVCVVAAHSLCMEMQRRSLQLLLPDEATQERSESPGRIEEDPRKEWPSCGRKPLRAVGRHLVHILQKRAKIRGTPPSFHLGGSCSSMVGAFDSAWQSKFGIRRAPRNTSILCQKHSAPSSTRAPSCCSPLRRIKRTCDTVTPQNGLQPPLFAAMQSKLTQLSLLMVRRAFLVLSRGVRKSSRIVAKIKKTSLTSDD